MRKFCSLMLLASSTLVFGAAAPCPEKPVQIKESSFEGEYLNNLVRKMDCTVQCGADKLTAQFEIVKNDAWVFMEFSAPVKDFALEKDVQSFSGCVPGDVRHMEIRFTGLCSKCKSDSVSE